MRSLEEHFPSVSDEKQLVEALLCEVAAFQRKQVERSAYELFVQRGGTHGHDLDDWLQARQELLRS